jgi:lipopolysaccharide export system permease protein
MKVLARYISGIFLKNFLLGVVALSLLFFFQAVMGQIFNDSYPTEQVLVYHALSLAQYVVQMTPPAVLLATMVSLSTLSRSNELVACYSIGVGLRQIMTIVLSIVFMVCCLLLVMQDRVLPPFFRKQTTYFWREMKKRPDFFLDLKQDKIWYRSKNMIYNLRSFDAKSDTIKGMAVYAFDEQFRLVEVIEAKEAQFINKEWRLRDGTVTVFSPPDDFPLTSRFETKELAIGETPTDFREIEKEVDGLRLKELGRYIDRMKDTGTETRSFLVKLHSKISLSFIPLVMCVLAIPFSTRNRRDEGVGRDLGLCLLITFFYWIFYSMALSLGTKGTLHPIVAAWLPSMVFTVVASGLLYFKWKK